MSGETFMQLTTALIGLLGIIITGVLVPYVRSKTTAGQQESIAMWATIGVNAAEQIFQGSGRGVEKKEYALDFLADKGVSITMYDLETLIESAVLELNQFKL